MMLLPVLAVVAVHSGVVVCGFVPRCLRGEMGLGIIRQLVKLPGELCKHSPVCLDLLVISSFIRCSKMRKARIQGFLCSPIRCLVVHLTLSLSVVSPAAVSPVTVSPAAVPQPRNC